MKKLFALVLAIALVMSMNVFALAANTTGGDAEITTSIAPTYTVTIPGNVIVKFNDPVTDFGKIEVTASQIHPDKCIKVELTYDRKLENSIDSTKIIPYVVKNDEGADFISATYLTEGDATELFIHITAEAWNAAYAGDYSDTVTFTVSYEDKK